MRKKLLFFTLVFSALFVFALLGACTAASFGGGGDVPDIKRNEVITIERNRLSFAKDMVVDETELIERCNISFTDGQGESVRVTRELLENGTVGYEHFELNEVGSNKQIKISYGSAENYIFYDVNSYKVNFFLDEEGEKLWKSVDATATVTKALGLSVYVDISQHNYSTDGVARLSDADGALRFNGWYDNAANSVTGRLGLSAPSEGNERVLNLHAHYISHEQLDDMLLEYDGSGRRVFSGYVGDKTDEVSVPEGVTYVDLVSVFNTVGANFSKLNLPSTAELDVPVMTAIDTTGLTEITVNKGNYDYASYKGALYSKDYTTLYLMPASSAVATFHPSLTEFGSYSCAYWQITSLQIPPSVFSLQHYCFAYSSVRTITGLADVKIIMTGAFYNSAVDSVDDGRALYVRVGESLILSTVYDKSVTEYSVLSETSSISGGAFRDCAEMRKVTLPNGIKRIGKSAFSGCVSLAEITLPESLEYLGPSVFYGCSSLVSVRGLNCVTFTDVDGNDYSATIPVELFYGCRKLSEIVLPDGLKNIGSKAFYNCVALTSIDIPDTVSRINSQAFYACGFKSVNLPTSLVYLGTSAFAYSQLTNIDLERCAALDDLAYGAFQRTKLTSLTIPDRFDEIPPYCFYYVNTLTTVKLGNVRKLGERAFSYCTKLTEMDFGDCLESIDSRVFSNCYLLDDVILPDTVVTVSGYAFQRCDGLSKITLGKNMKYFGAYPIEADGITFGAVENVLWQCYAIKEIAVADGNPYYTVTDGVLYGSHAGGRDFGDGGVLYAVPAAYGKTHLTLPQSVRVVLPYSLSYQKGLKSITLNDGLENIGKAAFYNASGITELRLPSTVTHIGASILLGVSSVTELTVDENNTVYRSDDNLVYSGDTLVMALLNKAENITVADGIDKIGSAVFMNAKITGVRIPDSVSEIGHNAFNGCADLKTLHIGKGLKTIASTAFSALKSLETITVDEGNPYFKAVNNALYSADGKTLYLVAAKNGMTSLAELNAGVTEIGDWAFSYHATLVSAILPSTVTEIGAYAFYECRKIDKLYASQSLERIGERAFSFATALTTATGETRYCNALKDVLLYDSLKSIGDYAFYGQYGIEHVFFHMSKMRAEALIAASGSNIAYLTRGCPMGTTGGYYNNITRCLYSATEPAINYDGYGWFYMEDGVPHVRGGIALHGAENHRATYSEEQK